MHQLVDFLPLIAFYIGYLLGGIYVATAALIGGCGVQIAIHYWHTRTVKPVHGITALLALIFGSATLLLRDPHFIQWKLSVLMWLMGGAFLGSQFIGTRPLAQRLLESTLGEHLASVSPRRWRAINLAWVLYFSVIGALNLYVARTFSEQTWVNFKVYGVTLLMLLFLCAQLLWLPLKVAQPGNDARLDENKR